MGSVLDGIDEDLGAWIEAQPLWFVATAPLDPDGHVNVSPKGGAGLSRVLAPRRFAYLDLFGSGIETVAHLRENGRIAVMLAAFDGRPRIVRLHGRGRVVQQRDPDWPALLTAFRADDEQRLAARSVVDVAVTRVSTSCGFVVPEMTYVGERRVLYAHAAGKVRRDGPDAVRDYCDVNNAASIDGLVGLDPFGDGPDGPDGAARERHRHEGRVL